MSKYGLRIAIFILNFAFGIGFVAILNLTIFDLTASENVTNAVNDRNEDIEIKFKEFVETEYGIAVDFFIINHSSDTFIYQAFINTEDSEPMFTHTELKIDGEKINERRCGFGINNFELKAGETKILRYFGNNLSRHWKNGKSVQIGYNLWKKSINTENYKTFWSENLPISDSIAEKLLKEQAQR